jgi:Tol biopolymer transport system component
MSNEGSRSHSWSQIASDIDALLAVGPEQRAARIAQLAGGDAARKAELDALAQELDRESSLLSRPAADQFSDLFQGEEDRFPPDLMERYDVRQVLGRGGMATVYLARDKKHGRDVAVKVLHELAAAALGGDRFLREIEIVAKLRYPLIVPLYDSGKSHDQLYYVMPYEAGLSLDRKIARDGPLPIADAVLVLRDVCDALAHAHEHGIVHRDIKPANVLLSGRHALVTDFGIAKAAAAESARTGLTAAGVLLGTPTYMAPEQISGDAIDSRADIYAVGVLGYELLTGRPPFVSTNRQEVFAAHLTSTPTPPNSIRPDIPAALTALVMKCLEKLPENRWQHITSVVQQLDALALTKEVPARRNWAWPLLGAAAIALVAIVAIISQRRATPESVWRDRWTAARIERLTDFPGDEVDAAISPDGKFAAFLADRDSVFDAYVSEIGSGQFKNLTNGTRTELFNEDVRNVGFSGDAQHVWLRTGDITAPATVSLVPTIGGPARTFLPGAVMAVWSPDRSKLAYHQAIPGDPIFIAEPDGSNARRIFIGNPGEHAHFISWAADGRFIYFSHGFPPNEMDIWRVPVSGGAAERITQHNSRVGYPTLVDARTLVYVASDANGGGPWLYSMDLESRRTTRLSSGVEHYLSISASAELEGQRRRFLATVSNPRSQLLSAAITSGVVSEDAITRLTLPLERAAAPRFARDSSLWYLASRSGADGVWQLRGTAREVWRPAEGTVTGAPAISPNGDRICMPVQRTDRATLYCAHSAGTGATALAPELDVRGAAAWSPDGQWLAVTAADSAGLRVFKVPVNGGDPVRLVDSASFNPVWSPDGRYIVYSGSPRARSVSIAAVAPNGSAYPMPTLSVDRLGDSYRFLPDGKQLVVKLGGFRRQNFWLVDLATGARRQLTSLKPGESILRFDVAMDGKSIVFERVRENSDVVVIELPPR